MTQLEIRTLLSKRVVDAIKNGRPPWRSNNRGLPTNAHTNKKYTGINPLVLDAVTDDRNYRSKYWATYHQWQLLGCQVPKKEVGIQIVNWQPFIKTHDKGNIISMEKFHLLQKYPVFNADQCFGNTIGRYLILKENVKTPDYPKVQEIVKATGAKIRHHVNVEFPRYDRMPLDRIMLPPKQRFIDPSQYWSAVLHELAHYSERRIGWLKPLHQGELFAEIVSGYMESELEIPHDPDMTHHNKWVDVWVYEIEKDPKYLFEAAAFAAKSVDWILGFTRTKLFEEGT